MELWIFVLFCVGLGWQIWWWFYAKPQTKERLRAVKKGCQRTMLNTAGKLAWWAIKKAR